MIGFIGLGQMGEPMARRLLDAGHKLIVYNRTQAKADHLIQGGARLAADFSEFAKADIVFSMLSEDKAVEDLIFRKGGLLESLPSGSVHVSLSTISPALSKKLGHAHLAKGQGYAAATVLGRPDTVAAGKLFVLAAGRAETLERIRPLLSQLGQKIFELGQEPEAANLVKLACNFMIASVIETLSESMTLIRKSGLVDPALFLQILTGTLFSAPVYQTYGKNLLEQNFKPGFRLPLGLKDIELGLNAAKDLSVPLPLASLIRDHFVAAIAQGHQELDWSALSLVALQSAGVKSQY